MSSMRSTTWALFLTTTALATACGDDSGTVDGTADGTGTTDASSTGPSTTGSETSSGPSTTSEDTTGGTTSDDTSSSSSTGEPSTDDSTDDGSTSSGSTGDETTRGESTDSGESTETGDTDGAAPEWPFVADFDTTPPVPDAQRGWTASVFAESHEANGGNPDGYLRAQPVGIFIPMFHTEYGLVNQVVGDKDYAELGVSRISFDFNLMTQVGGATQVPITLMLVNDGGTPFDQSDDTAAYFVSEQAPPSAGGGWVTYTFDIPSSEAALPPGWALYDMGGAPIPGMDWIDVITDVDRIVIWRGEPDWFYLLGDFVFGLDNVTIELDFE